MTYFFKNRFHFERIDILIFTGHKHACYTGDVQISNLFDILAPFEVSVHETNSQKEGLIITLKIS